MLRCEAGVRDSTDIIQRKAAKMSIMSNWQMPALATGVKDAPNIGGPFFLMVEFTADPGYNLGYGLLLFI